MLRFPTRPPTRNFIKRLLATNARRKLHPERGEKGKPLMVRVYHTLTHEWLVVVAMSGGVDSSVTAKLMVDQVRYLQRRLSLRLILTCVAGSRVMMLLDFSCATGTRETNPGPTRGANGKRIGRMYGWCPRTWVYPAEWCVYIYWTVRCVYGDALEGRSHEGVLEQRVPTFTEGMGNR